MNQLRSWWDNIHKIGPEYGYLANPTKNWLIVKEEYLSAASEAFQNTRVHITSQGKRYLGEALGTASFIEAYVELQVEKWVLEIETGFNIQQPTTCCLHCFSAWICCKLELCVTHHSGHRRPARPCGESNSPQTVARTYWHECSK